MSTFKVNRGDEERILFLIYERLKFFTERGASFFIAEGFLIWVMKRGAIMKRGEIVSNLK